MSGFKSPHCHLINRLVKNEYLALIMPIFKKIQAGKAESVLYQVVRRKMDKCEPDDTIYLDLLKVFAKFPHQRLLKKVGLVRLEGS